LLRFLSVRTVWFAPALATGAVFAVEIVTLAGGLFTIPSLTINWTTYCPALSAKKVGLAVVEPLSVAPLPVGIVVNDHW